MNIFNPIRYFLRKLLYQWLILLGLLMLTVTASCQSIEQPVGQVQRIENPAAENARFPYLSPLPDGAVLMSWVEELNDGHALKFAVYRHGQWEKQGEAAQGAGWFVNWADFPAVTAIDASFWVAHWLVQSAGGSIYDYDILVAVSTNAGISWSMSQTPYQDRTAAAHGFVSIFPVDRDAGIVWLDGRNYIKHKSGSFALRYVRIHRDGSFAAEQLIDDSTCSCCRTAAAATTATGPVIAWRSLREHSVRDHHIARLLQNRWTTPLPLSQESWSMDGCPVNGPALAIRGEHIVASWFTAEGNRPRVRAAFSSIDRLQFRKTFEVDEAKPAGRIKIEWLNDHAAVVMWLTAMDNTTKKASVAVRKIFIDGTMSPIKRLIDISPGRDSGIPQLIKNESDFMLAWTSAAPGYGVQTVRLPLEVLAQ